jgi:ribosomal protein L2
MLLISSFFITNLQIRNYNQFSAIRLFFKLHQLKTMTRICFLSALPSKKIQYIKSSGSYGTLIHLNMLNHTAIVKLPSGIKKIFSIYTLVSYGAVSLSIKKKICNTKAGF